ncbi:MAG TPA: hypothetical protein VJQ45_01480 [Ktedonobacterales bacterium]|nr:hypothetical protein [Ktedonobacterales bacterium]
MPDTPLAKKLRILPGSRVLILGAPQGFAQTLDPLPEGTTIAARPDGTYDIVLAFAGDSAQLAAVRDAAIAATKPGGALWFAYPKKSTGKGDLQRESVWELVRPTGWGPVAQIALDETWSALRFKPEREITRGGHG